MPHTRYKNSCKISKQVIVLLIFGFALAFKVSAQSNYGGLPFIKNHQKSEYNAATQNWAITQDKKGVLYFGNNEGVLIFDGLNWKTLPVTNFSVVRSLAIDKNEKIWVGSFNEIGFLQKNPIGKTEYISIIDLIPDKHKNFGDVWKIHTTEHGIYFQTFSHIFFYDFNQIEIISSKGNYHFSFYIDKRFFIQDKSKGLMELRGKKLFLLQGGEIFINKIEVWSMLKLDNDQILVCLQS